MCAQDCVLLPAIPFWKLERERLAGRFWQCGHVRAQGTHNRGSTGVHVESLGFHTLYCTSAQMAPCDAYAA